jgi:5-methyltetrahydrofolate--homocysteine methyltransferase
MDGAMGTMIQQHHLTEADFRGVGSCGLHGHAHDLRGDNDLLVLTQPEVIRAIHDEYLEAGADIVETNTFSATSIAQADYGLESRAKEINFAAARIARSVAMRGPRERRTSRASSPARSAPTNRTASISPDVNDPARAT